MPVTKRPISSARLPVLRSPADSGQTVPAGYRPVAEGTRAGSGQIELYQEIGSAYEGNDDYDNAIANFSLYIQKAPEDQVQVADYFNLGKAALLCRQ